MRHKRILEIIQRHHVNNVLTFEDVLGKTAMTSSLDRGRSGLYWFWTSYSELEMSNCVRPINLTGEINVSTIVSQRKDLGSICQIEQDEFRIVYNGIGGSTGTNYGLRERILQEIRGQEGTGSISILNSSLNDCTRWRVTFLDFEDELFLRDVGEEISYTEEGELFEMLWRLHYGWPILCRR